MQETWNILGLQPSATKAWSETNFTTDMPWGRTEVLQFFNHLLVVTESPWQYEQWVGCEGASSVPGFPFYGEECQWLNRSTVYGTRSRQWPTHSEWKRQKCILSIALIGFVTKNVFYPWNISQDLAKLIKEKRKIYYSTPIFWSLLAYDLRTMYQNWKVGANGAEVSDSEQRL